MRAIGRARPRIGFIGTGHIGSEHIGAGHIGSGHIGSECTRIGFTRNDRAASLRRFAGAACACLAACGAAFAQERDDAEPVVFVQVLDNGDFAAAPAVPGAARGAGEPGRARIPWWIQRPASAAPRVDLLNGEPGAWTPEGVQLLQPIPAYGPLLERLHVTGEVGGFGVVTLRDGLGGIVNAPQAGVFGGMQRFEITGAALAAELDRGPLPRVLLQLGADTDTRSATGVSEARWAKLEARVALPCPSEESLRAELLAELHRAIDPWLERGLDDLGERRTSFLCQVFDAQSGERIGGPQVPAHPLNPLFADVLFDAVAAAPEERAWSEALERYLADLLELGLHPTTGLPCRWDPVRDARVEDAPLELARPLAFLLDVAESGPEAFRERARAAAVRIGEHVLARGLFPDGTVAPSYRPSDGEPVFDVPPIRRLDVPAQLARLGALTGDARFADAAREACLEIEFTLYWPGDWDSIDPGFDDSYGHYGARALVISKALPEHAAGAAAERIALSGFERYAPLWRDALRFGGNVAADQVRCWKILAEIADRVPERRAEIVELLDMAVRSHWKGGQRDGGAWIDVTAVGFWPRDLPVGDTGGVPQNLLAGLGSMYSDVPELRTDETRARFTAVLRATRAAFGAEHGLVGSSRGAERGGAASGSPRFAIGLVAMLRGL